jgi:hypothetical protein
LRPAWKTKETPSIPVEMFGPQRKMVIVSRKDLLTRVKGL